MALYILDTDIATLAFHAHPVVLVRIGQALLAGDQVALSIVTLREIMEGRIQEIARSTQPRRSSAPTTGSANPRRSSQVTPFEHSPRLHSQDSTLC